MYFIHKTIHLYVYEGNILINIYVTIVLKTNVDVFVVAFAIKNPCNILKMFIPFCMICLYVAKNCPHTMAHLTISKTAFGCKFAQNRNYFSVDNKPCIYIVLCSLL